MSEKTPEKCREKQLLLKAMEWDLHTIIFRVDLTNKLLEKICDILESLVEKA